MKNLFKSLVLAAGLTASSAEKVEAQNKPASTATDNVTTNTTHKNEGKRFLDAPSLEECKKLIDHIQFTDEYSDEEREAIINYLKLRIKILERLEFLIATDNSGTDPKALKVALKGIEGLFGIGIKSIVKSLTHKSERKFYIPNVSIDDDEMAINIEASRMRTEFINNIKNSQE